MLKKKRLQLYEFSENKKCLYLRDVKTSRVPRKQETGHEVERSLTPCSLEENELLSPQNFLPTLREIVWLRDQNVNGEHQTHLLLCPGTLQTPRQNKSIEERTFMIFNASFETEKQEVIKSIIMNFLTIEKVFSLDQKMIDNIVLPRIHTRGCRNAVLRTPKELLQDATEERYRLQIIEYEELFGDGQCVQQYVAMLKFERTGRREYTVYLENDAPAALLRMADAALSRLSG